MVVYQIIIKRHLHHLGHNSIFGDCSCNDYVSDLGYGKCRKEFRGGPVCYVNQPSACADVADSENEPEKQYSWEACSRVKVHENTFPSKTYGIDDDVSV